MTGNLNNVSVILEFFSSSGNQFNTNLKGIGTNDTYFIVPSDVQEDTYYMGYVTIIDSNERVNCSTTLLKDSNGNVAYPYVNTNGQNRLNVYVDKADGEDPYGFIDVVKSLSFKKNTANLGDEIKLNFTPNEEMDSMWFKFYNDTIDTVITVPVSNIKGSDAPYFATNGMGATKPFVEGLTYKLKSVSIWTDNYSTEYAYNLSDLGLKELTLTINKTTNNVTTDEHQDLKEVNFIADDGVNKSVTANLNDSVNVELDWKGTAIKSAMFSLKNKSTSEVLTVYLKGLSKQPYFIVPYTAKPGIYELDYVIITDVDGNKFHFRRGESATNITHFDFGCSLTINDVVGKNEEGIYEFDNARLDGNIVTIHELEENTVVTVNANEYSIIPESLFEAIKGQDKTLIIEYMENQWIFYGKDIVNPKEIDVSILITELSQTTAKPLTSMMSHAVVLDFAANGYLPGKTLIRIKADEVNMEGLEEGKKYYTYYFDELNEKLDRIAMDKILADGYYEFYINHNSTYVITNGQVDSKYVSDKTEDLALNQEIENTSTITTTTEVKENATTKMDENLTLKIIIIVLCVIILIIVLCGKKFFVGIKKDNK